MTDFNQWQSPLSLSDIFSKPASPTYLQANDDGHLFWMESLSDEGGRTVIKSRDLSGDIKTITPQGYSVRSRVNEYGGKAYTINSTELYFCNYADQCIYRQSLVEGSDQTPIAITVADAGLMYADLHLSADGQYLLFVMETEQQTENVTQIAFVTTQGSNREHPAVLVTGSDFYSSLTLSEDNQQLAWVQWGHPNMPWDETTCNIARLSITNKQLTVQSITPVVEGAGVTASQLEFTPNGKLLLAIDWPDQEKSKNYANLYCWYDGELTAITSGTIEYGAPHWVFGDKRIVALSDDLALAIATSLDGDRLLLVELKTRKINRLCFDFNQFSYLCVVGTSAAVVAHSAIGKTRLLSVNDRGETQSLTLGDTAPPLLGESDTSVAQRLEIGTGDHLCHAYYYPPKNSHHEIPRASPPLLVMVHGGPTARCQNSFDIQKQFWTTHGFAVIDINHRGSTGYGRKFRDALLGQWGVADTADVKATIEFVIDQGLADSDRVFIRGRSAGGYAVQRALTEFPELFAAGASYYGIGDLATLAAITHKFEAYYCDQLLGETYDSERAKKVDSAYYNRSPIHFMDKIRCPMILFQGLDDKVVPPELSQQVADVLKQQGVAYEHHEYAGEGHGFRSKETLIDCLQKELNFYRAQMVDG